MPSRASIPRSSPAQNARGPAPRMTTTPTDGSAATRSTAWPKSRIHAMFIAFSTSGRLRVTRASGPSRSSRTVADSDAGDPRPSVASELRKRGDDFLAEQLDRPRDQVRRHAPELVVRAEQVVAQPGLTLPQPTDDRLGTADQRQPVLDVEVVVGRGL